MTNDTAKRAVKLLPCPFCGAQPHRQLGKVWYDQLHGDRHQDTVVKCPHLCATMTGGEDTVVDRWNQRSDRAFPSYVIERTRQQAREEEQARCATVARMAMTTNPAIDELSCSLIAAAIREGGHDDG